MMPRLCEVEREILAFVNTHDRTHRTYIRRHLDQQFDVRITYIALDAFLDGLEEKNYITPVKPEANYYAQTPQAPQV